MYLVGLFLAVFAGFVLGLLGGGGSILTLPILVYIFGENPELSTSYSLFIVGVAALLGAFRYMTKKLVEYKAAIVFAIPGAIGVAVAQGLLMPLIPDTLIETSSFTLSKDAAIMVFFSIVMVVAALSMIRGRKDSEEEAQELKFNYPMIMLEGLGVGLVTGIVGAGGGFLIVPALVVLARMPIKLAIGTSLLIISAKSLFGFFVTMSGKAIDWPFLLLFTGLSVVGIVVGTYTSKFVSPKPLKKGFGWFVLVMGAFLLIKELWLD